MFENDRRYIENKYHKTDEPFNPYNRRAYHGYAFAADTGLCDDEIKSGLDRLFEQIKDLPHPIAKARAVEYVLDNTRIDVNEHDLFVGFWSVDRLAERATVSKWYDEVFNEKIPETNQKMDDMNKSGAVSIWPDFDHVVPDWRAVLSLGFSGLAERAKHFKVLNGGGNSALYDGIIIEYEAVVRLVNRLYELAAAKNDCNSKRMAKCLKNIRCKAPQNTYEAMQVIYIYFMISECFDSYQVRSLGNGLDGTLYPFYANDIKNGTFTREEIKELLKYFFMQWSAMGNYWGQSFYMGGTYENGNTKYNDLSYDILQVYDELEIYNPKIQMKINKNTPDKILFKVFDMIRRGHNCFALCLEPGMMRAVMSYGATFEEALNMDIRGCYETGVRANEVSSATGYINAPKATEYVFTNGYDRNLKKQFGVKTGILSDFKTFEDFYMAVLKQWENLIEMTIDVSLSYEKYLSYINPSNMYTATIEGALKKGEDAYQSGVKFNNSAILNCGFATLVDCVMAVKEFVYDKKEVTLEEFARALESNWAGFEDLRSKVQKSAHKYGNDDEQTDMYAEAMSAYFTSKINNRPNARGGVYKSVMHSAMQFVWQGQITGATADGRKSGEEMSKNASPSVGMDKNGVTALINSALKTRPYTYLESHCLDICLHPSAVSGDEGLEVMKSLLFAYMAGGGEAVQFNVFDENMLRDAQKNPEKYKNLQLRVCGWNVLWNNLSESEQNSYILRAKNID